MTKRRVKRRQQRQRLVSKNAKRNVRSVRKHRKTAKKMMRGGMFGKPHAAIAAEHASEMQDYNDHTSAPKLKNGVAFVVYDTIPTAQTTYESYGSPDRIIRKNVPICVVFMVGKTFMNMTLKHDVYLFFNNRMTASDITTTVKLLLGISENETFVLTPPIVLPESHPMKSNLGVLWSVTGNMFVKISGCWADRRYCVHSGIILNENTSLDQIETTEHKITTNNETYNGMNGEKFEKHIRDKSEKGFKNRLLTAVLPNLYKNYFVEANPNYTPEYDVSQKAVELYGPDIEWSDPKVEEEGKKKPIIDGGKTYPEFKQSKIKEIEKTILDNERHIKYGIKSTEVNQLNEKRPLEITFPFSIKYLNMDTETIFRQFEANATYFIGPDGLTGVENWWVSEEGKELKKKVQQVQKEKNDRIRTV